MSNVIYTLKVKGYSDLSSLLNHMLFLTNNPKVDMKFTKKDDPEFFLAFISCPI